MSIEAFKVKRWKRGNRSMHATEETGEITGPDALAMAMRLAERWAEDKGNRSVNIVRADLQGINAGKFFLHHIIR